MTNKVSDITAKLAIGLIATEVLLLIVSWGIAAAMPETHVRSMLSSEGIRWFFGSFTDNLLTPLLVWILFVCMAWGAARASGLLSISLPLPYRQRFALRIVLIEIAVILIIVLLLTALPHAVLLSATGRLFPSSFSESIVPVACISLIIVSVSYGLFAGTFSNFSQAIASLTNGVGNVGSIWLIYILLIELIESIKFVFYN